MEVKVEFGLLPNVASETSNARAHCHELCLYRRAAAALHNAAGSE
jgi:hypothetical protein